MLMSFHTFRSLPIGWLHVVREKMVKDIRSRRPIPRFTVFMDILTDSDMLDVFDISRFVGTCSSARGVHVLEKCRAKLEHWELEMQAMLVRLRRQAERWERRADRLQTLADEYGILIEDLL